MTFKEMHNLMQTVLRDCENVEFTVSSAGKNVPFYTGKVTIDNTRYCNRGYCAVKDDKKNHYVKVTGTSIKGTIGRIIGLEIYVSDPSPADKADGIYGQCISPWELFIHFEVDGREKPGRIALNQSEFLDNYTAQTYWSKPKRRAKAKALPAPVNKYAQTIHVGDWVVGSSPSHKKIVFGKVSRYTHASIWVKVSDEKDAAEFRIVSHWQCFVLPKIDEDLMEQHIMMLALSGWKGEQ